MLKKRDSSVITALIVLCVSGAPAQDGNCPPAEPAACHSLVTTEESVEKTGKTLSDWGDAWWKWVLEIPEDRSPFKEQFCREGQEPSSPVFFLVGSFGQPVRRSCSVSCGQRLFFPIITDVEWSPEIPECETCQRCMEFAASVVDSADLLYLEVDGCSYRELNAQRHPSKGCFEVVLPSSNLLQQEPGSRVMAQDGFWIMLEPLPAGRHQVRFRGSISNPVFDTFCVEYDLTVLPCGAFLRGETNLDGKVDIADAVHVLNALFAGGPPLACSDSADANDDGKVNISDSVFTLNHLFLGGAPLPWPGLEVCGADPTEDDIDCARSTCEAP